MKKLSKLVIIAVLVSGLAACSNANAATPVANVNTETSGSEAADNKPETSSSTDTAGEEQKKTVYGEVVEVIGNSINLKLIETPAINGNFGASGGNFTIDGKTIQEMIEEAGGEEKFREQMQERMNNGQGAQFQAPDGAVGNFQRGEGGAFYVGEGNATTRNFGDGSVPSEVQTFSVESSSESSGQPSQSGDGQTRQFRGNTEGRTPQNRYTGEELEILIPVGMSIVTTSMGESGVVETPVKIETIKSGNMLLVAYAEDGVTIEKVTLMQSGGRMNIPRGASGGAGGDMGFIGGGAREGMIIFDAVPAGPGGR